MTSKTEIITLNVNVNIRTPRKKELKRKNRDSTKREKDDNVLEDVQNPEEDPEYGRFIPIPTLEDLESIVPSIFDDLQEKVHEKIRLRRGETIDNIRDYMEEFQRACEEILNEEKVKTKKGPKSKGCFSSIKRKITGAWNILFGR